MKLLNDSVITTIKQLSEAPLEKLTQIDRLSEHYAKLIKDAATEVYGKKPEETAPETGADKEKKNIIKIADALSATLKNVGKKPKKKKYQKVSQEIQSFSKVLK